MAKKKPAGPLSPVWTRTGHEGAIRCLALSPDGSLLASGGDDARVKLWDLRAASAGEEASAEMRGHRYGIASVAFSPDGRAVASVSIGKRTASGKSDACLWDLVSRRHHALEQEKGQSARAACFTRDGALAVAGLGEVRLYDGLTGEAAGAIPGAGGYAIAGGPDGLVAVAGNDSWSVHRAGRKTPVARLDAVRPGFVNVLSFSPSGDSLAAANIGEDSPFFTAGMISTNSCPRAVRFWSREGWKPRGEATPVGIATRCLVLLNDNDWVSCEWATGEPETVVHWGTAGQVRTRTLPLEGVRALSAALSRDGRLLATGSQEGMIQLWRLQG